MDTGSLEYNVIVVKWGNKFTAEHVNRLYRMAKKNITLPFNFYCYTEDSTDIYDEVKIKPLDESLKLEKWWWKLTLFKQNDLSNGINLFLDLDVIIQNNIDHLFKLADHNKLTLIDNFSFTSDSDSYFNKDRNSALESKQPYYNSSIMVWNNNENKDFFDIFIKKYKMYTNLYLGIDGFLSHEISSSRFLDIGVENYYFRTKSRIGEIHDEHHKIIIDKPTEVFRAKGKLLANFNYNIPICVFNQAHEDIFYRGMEKFLL